VVLKAVEDASVVKEAPTANKGGAHQILVDGGNPDFGDAGHEIAYLKFKLDIPGKPVRVTLRLHNAGNPTGDSGRVCLVTEPWSEMAVTYEKRPKLGEELAKIGPVAENQVVEVPLKVSLAGRKELSLALDPTDCDGVDYGSREGGRPAELVVEYEER
jgi:hypothetical protein